MPKSKKVATPNPNAGANPTATSSSKGRKRKNVERDDGYDVQSGNTSHPSPAVPQADVPLSVGGDDAPRETPSKKPRNEETSPATEQTEKRLRRFRPRPPQAFEDIYLRATTQRFYVLSRTRVGTPDCPEEKIELTGSTGNVYTVTISRLPSCDCPHARKGNQCKHLVWVLAKVLRARRDLVYQLALLSSELREIFDGAPPIGNEAEADGKRKPVEGDCPICFCEMEADGKGTEAVVWCRATCGQNIHKGCFETWRAMKMRDYGASGVTCPYCRSVWEDDGDIFKDVVKDGERNEEGYVNVADQLGISTRRDYSTYSWWHSRRNYYRRRY